MTERATVLVVDDDPDIRVALEDLLPAFGYSVVTASNGQEALDRLDAGLSVDLVLVDLLMPVMDGWTFLEALRVRDARSAIPVVVMSALGDRALVSRAVELLPKPFEMHRLRAALDGALRRTVLAREARHQL